MLNAKLMLVETHGRACVQKIPFDIQIHLIFPINVNDLSDFTIKIQ